jgi:hypothetical protein
LFAASRLNGLMIAGFASRTSLLILARLPRKGTERPPYFESQQDACQASTVLNWSFRSRHCAIHADVAARIVRLLVRQNAYEFRRHKDALGSGQKPKCQFSSWRFQPPIVPWRLLSVCGKGEGAVQFRLRPSHMTKRVHASR